MPDAELVMKRPGTTSASAGRDPLFPENACLRPQHPDVRGNVRVLQPLTGLEAGRVYRVEGQSKSSESWELTGFTREMNHPGTVFKKMEGTHWEWTEEAPDGTPDMEIMCPAVLALYRKFMERHQPGSQVSEEEIQEPYDKFVARTRKTAGWT